MWLVQICHTAACLWQASWTRLLLLITWMLCPWVRVAGSKRGGKEKIKKDVPCRNPFSWQGSTLHSGTRMNILSKERTPKIKTSTRGIRVLDFPTPGVRMLLLCHVLTVAVVQTFIFSENRVFAKNINFYNVRPPLDPTPFPNSFKCFTCENAGDNYNCNRWAEDKWCPQNTQYCLTVHHFTSHGRSISITKKCASRSECHFVGCHHSQDSEHTECRSCCEGMICNVELPTNHTNAVFAVMHAQRTSGSGVPVLYLPVLAWAFVLPLI
uniref:LY6/PLAUR domain containing 6B n=2 Tax=Capra hircus TaxID=9925 RepID=A0A8C2NGA2_CAPHI